MIYLLIFIIFVMEAIFGLALFRLYQQNFSANDLLEAIGEERASLNKLRTDVLLDLEKIDKKKREVLEKLNQIAAEVDHDLTNSRATMEGQLTELIQDASARLSEPLTELVKKQNSLDVFLRKLQKERDLLQAMITRAEQLYRFFTDKGPVEEIIKDIEYKKYDDARRMFAQGFSPERIMKELGLKKAEVQMMLGWEK